MDKSKYRARTLDDPSVVEGLCAVSKLEGQKYSQGLSFLVGGVATQSYLPSSCRRETADIDLAILRPLTNSEFREFSAPVSGYLRDRGFIVEEKKGHNAYMIVYSQKEEEHSQSPGIIEFARRSPANLERILPRLMREFDHTRVKIIEGRGESYRISSPEDIVIPKMVRGVRALKAYPEMEEDLGEPFPVTSESIKRDLQKIRELKKELRMFEGDLDRASRFRFVSDIYDIKVLAELTGFNEGYLIESLNSWDCLREPTIERDILLGKLFPNLVLFTPGPKEVAL